LNPKYVPTEVRREIYDKTNSKELVKFLSVSQFVPAYGLIPNGFGGTLAESDVADLKKEKRPYQGKKVSFKLDYLANSEFDLRLAQWLKEKWNSTNIEVVLNPVPQAERLSRMFSKKSEATIGRKGTDYPDGYSILTYFKGKYESNYFHVDDPDIDASISVSSKEFDSDKRAKLYKEIQKKILRHYTNIPLYFGSQASGLWSPKVSKLPSHPLGAHTMPFESIEMRTP
jgi:ABC-type transport system substrate-binding protein